MLRGYVIFNDVKLPTCRGNISHIVIGEDKIVIETKNYSGHYIIDGGTWYKVKGDEEIELYKDPGRQVKYNILRLKEFLRENGIRKRIWMEAIIVMINNNATIHKQPPDYTVLGAS
ncbi:MAG TPA: NERD domain-containing protein [Methanobacteriales archaeon]|nr:NERD domain-containing protein [Methanobacteriaceae archaeon]MBC7096090.1 NERD domain-containing protein [Methanobacteriales archaeon]HIH62073.1 NERD domain-containing protein [Methanobacteriales archaeon]